MTNVYPHAVQELIDELGRLPGIGPKSAQRIAFHLLKLPSLDALRLSTAIVRAKERVTFCSALLQHRRGRRRRNALRALRGHAPRPHGAVRRRGAA